MPLIQWILNLETVVPPVHKQYTGDGLVQLSGSTQYPIKYFSTGNIYLKGAATYVANYTVAPAIPGKIWSQEYNLGGTYAILPDYIKRKKAKYIDIKFSYNNAIYNKIKYDEGEIGLGVKEITVEFIDHGLTMMLLDYEQKPRKGPKIWLERVHRIKRKSKIIIENANGQTNNLQKQGRDIQVSIQNRRGLR